MAKKTKKNAKYLKIGTSKITIWSPKHKKEAIIAILCCTILGITIFIAWRNSYLWPWPSQSEIDSRLSEVIDTCSYNENSQQCKNLAKQYDMNFQYCRAVTDIPEIGKTVPIYGVARKNSFETVGLSSLRESIKVFAAIIPGEAFNKNKTVRMYDYVYPYYGCSETLSGINSNINDNLIPEQKMIALSQLAHVPQLEVYGESNTECGIRRVEINDLWNQVPGMQSILNEGKTTIDIYNKCSMISSIRKSANSLNDKLTDYANDIIVQLFYKKFDEWNAGIWKKDNQEIGCTWQSKTFEQYCISKSDNSNSNWKTLREYADFEQYFLNTDNYMSKILITD